MVDEDQGVPASAITASDDNSTLNVPTPRASRRRASARTRSRARGCATGSRFRAEPEQPTVTVFGQAPTAEQAIKITNAAAKGAAEWVREPGPPARPGQPPHAADPARRGTGGTGTAARAAASSRRSRSSRSSASAVSGWWREHRGVRRANRQPHLVKPLPGNTGARANGNGNGAAPDAKRREGGPDAAGEDARGPTRLVSSARFRCVSSTAFPTAGRAETKGLLARDVEVSVWCTSLHCELPRPAAWRDDAAGQCGTARALGGRNRAYHDLRVARALRRLAGQPDVVHVWPRASLRHRPRGARARPPHGGRGAEHPHRLRVRRGRPRVRAARHRPAARPRPARSTRAGCATRRPSTSHR